MTELAALGLLGFVVGSVGTLVGVGGGFVLVPVLLLLYPHRPPEEVTAMSLLVVCANSLSGSVAYLRQRRVDIASGAWFALATFPGAVLGAIVVRQIPRATFSLLFAAVLAAIGVWLLVPRTASEIREPLRGRGVVTRMITDRRGQTFLYAYRLWQGMGISAVVGFVSSLLGIGGGIVHVPAMAVVLHFPVHIATATSQFVLALMTMQATGTHLFTGTLGWDRTLALASTMAVGAVTGAQVGARLAVRLPGEAIIRVLGVLMLVVALRMAFEGLARR